MSKANETQVGGTHYKGTPCPHCGESLEHWDLAWLFRWDNFQYAIIKYVMRWREKAGLQDLEKAQHCLEKYMEVVAAEDPDKFMHYPERQRMEIAKPGDITSAGKLAVIGDELVKPSKLILPEGVDEETARRVLAAGGLRWKCDDVLCPGHHLAQQRDCENDPPGPLAGTHPTPGRA